MVSEVIPTLFVGIPIAERKEERVVRRTPSEKKLMLIK